jgi:demethylmenaquinone methyltransferase/2-methoxy-6-polyprenyl-1,4-benzoquinol methylase
MAFGLRNVTDKARALADICRILKPGGRALILEFSHVHNPLFGKLYDFHSFQVLPRLGRVITQDRDSYEYLAESIRKHPDQATLKHMMEQAGFGHVTVRNLTDGIVAIHRGYKL